MTQKTLVFQAATGRPLRTGAQAAGTTKPPLKPGLTRKVIRDDKMPSDRKHDDASLHERLDDDGVIGEIEKPAPPSEKPEAC